MLKSALCLLVFSSSAASLASARPPAPLTCLLPVKDIRGEIDPTSPSIKPGSFKRGKLDSKMRIAVDSAKLEDGTAFRYEFGGCNEPHTTITVFSRDFEQLSYDSIKFHVKTALLALPLKEEGRRTVVETMLPWLEEANLEGGPSFDFKCSEGGDANCSLTMLDKTKDHDAGFSFDVEYP